MVLADAWPNLAWTTLTEDCDSVDLESQEDLDRELTWLCEAWDDLVQAIPEVGKIGKSKAQVIREKSVVRSAVVVYGYVGVLCQIRELDEDPAALLPALPGTLALTDNGVETRLDEVGTLVPRYEAGEKVDFFSYGNPLWQQVGLLVPMTDPQTGLTRMQMRNARQTRHAVLDALATRVGCDLQAPRLTFDQSHPQPSVLTGGCMRAW